MKNRTGFTLIELVVVILILGILAGVAAPKMFDTSARATHNTLLQTLSIVRDAIELYTADPENGSGTTGQPPPFTTSAAFHASLSKYIRGNFPVCPVGMKDNVVVGTATATDADGAWRYDATTGDFGVNSTSATAITTDGATTYTDL